MPTREQIRTLLASKYYEEVTNRDLASEDANTYSETIQLFLSRIFIDQNSGDEKGLFSHFSYLMQCEPEGAFQFIRLEAVRFFEGNVESIFNLIFNLELDPEVKGRIIRSVADVARSSMPVKNALKGKVIRLFSVGDIGHSEIINLVRVVEEVDEGELFHLIERSIIDQKSVALSDFDCWLDGFYSMGLLLSHYLVFARQEYFTNIRSTFFPGIPPSLWKKYLEVWSSASKIEDKLAVIRNNMKILYQLESEYPGYAQELFTLFGRVEFSAHEVETILAQAELKTYSGPIIVEIKDTDDHNTALKANSDFSQMHKFVDEATVEGDEYDLRSMLAPKTVKKVTFEGSSIVEIYLRMKKFLEKFPVRWQVLTFLVQVHSSEYAFGFGGGRLEIEDIEGLNLTPEEQKLRLEMVTFFKSMISSDTQVILKACSTGKSSEGFQSVGEVAAKVLGTKVIAPAVPAASTECWNPKIGNLEVVYYLPTHRDEPKFSKDVAPSNIFDYRK